MNYSEALAYINSLEFKEIIFNEPFQAYSIIRDCIGNSFEYTIIAKRFLEINYKLNVFRIMRQYGVSDGLDIMKQAYKDLFTDIPLDEYKSTVKPIAMLYDANYFSHNVLKKAMQKDKQNWITFDSNETLYLNNIFEHLNVNSTVGNVIVKEAKEFYIKVDSNIKENINFKYQILNNSLKVSLTYKKRCKLDCNITIGLPANYVNSINIKTLNCNIDFDVSCNNICLKSETGDIQFYGICDKSDISSTNGEILYAGKSSYAFVRGRKSKTKVKYNILKYHLDKYDKSGLVNLVLTDRKML